MSFNKSELKCFNADAALSILGGSEEFTETTFEEYAAAALAKNIKEFISKKHDAGAYKNFVQRVFREVLECGKENPVWLLLDYLENETDFYTAPASTKFHGNYESGLIRHSLAVMSNGLALAHVMLCGEVDMYYLILSCLFHDLCKVNMYEAGTRNSKNEETGAWEKVPYYKVKSGYISCGHGVESVLRLGKYINMPEGWNHAVRYHMGAYDIGELDKISMAKSLSAYREVLFLQTADIQAGLVDLI